MAVEVEPTSPPEAHPYSVSPLAVSLIVERMMEDRLPLDNLVKEKDWKVGFAKGKDWKDAYRLNVIDYHAMSLVHSTWTHIARSALQRRVVVPYQQIDRFLLSPLCGPWIREMIVYWMIDNGDEGATRNNVDLLGALLQRTPQLRSLVFVPSLTWSSSESEERDPPPFFRISDIFDLIPSRIPHLEHLWFWRVLGRPTGGDSFRNHDDDAVELFFRITDSLERCSESGSLSHQLSRLQSLKFLSMNFGASHGFEWKRMFKWECIFEFRVPREASGLFGLRCTSYALEKLGATTWPHLEKLQLRNYLPSSQDTFHVLLSCQSLTHLELLVVRHLPPVGVFPPSLVHLKIQEPYSHGILDDIFLDPSFYPETFQHWRDHILCLPRLRSLVVSTTDGSWHPQLTRRIKHFASVVGEECTNPLIELCKERRIQLVAGGIMCSRF